MSTNNIAVKTYCPIRFCNVTYGVATVNEKVFMGCGCEFYDHLNFQCENCINNFNKMYHDQHFLPNQPIQLHPQSWID
jgi:hypothetical protein